MTTEIICSLIEAGGGILSAIISTTGVIIAALIARKVVKNDIKPILKSYSDESHNPSNLINKAKHSIIIVTASGLKLIPRVKSDIEKKLSAGIQIRFLYLTLDEFLRMEKYLHGDKGKGKIQYNLLTDTLRELSQKYRNQFQVRTFSAPMSASYIGIDILSDLGKVSSNSVIQVMQYQYMINASASPIISLYPGRDAEHFDRTVETIQKMWETGIEVPLNISDDSH